jgi:hypothetical protein
VRSIGEFRNRVRTPVSLDGSRNRIRENASCRAGSSRNNSFSLKNGVLAQLVERLNGIEEVRGSSPLGSITFIWRDLHNTKAQLSTSAHNNFERI